MSASLHKLLSHRLRGAGPGQLSQECFERFAEIPLPYVEFDTRVTAEGTIVVAHDANFPREDGSFGRFTEARDHEIPGSYITLDTALGVYANSQNTKTQLLIDIKDGGFERKHLQLVRKHGFEERTSFISWLPQSLVNLHSLGTSRPLILSHWNLSGLGLLGRFFACLFNHRKMQFGDTILSGSEWVFSPLGSFEGGYTHATVASEFDERFLSILREGQGGFCVPTFLCTSQLRRYCARESILLAVFNTHSHDEYQKWARFPEVEIVFNEQADTIWNKFSGNKFSESD